MVTKCVTMFQPHHRLRTHTHSNVRVQLYFAVQRGHTHARIETRAFFRPFVLVVSNGLFSVGGAPLLRGCAFLS